jgi:hypothetical protein
MQGLFFPRAFLPPGPFFWPDAYLGKVTKIVSWAGRHLRFISSTEKGPSMYQYAWRQEGLISRNHIPLGEERPWGKKGPRGRKALGEEKPQGRKSSGGKKDLCITGWEGYYPI